MRQQSIRRMLLALALVLPSSYGLFMVSIDNDTSHLGDTVPILAYSIS